MFRPTTSFWEKGAAGSGASTARWRRVPSVSSAEIPMAGGGGFGESGPVEEYGQGQFGSCAAHALLNVIVQQLTQKYDQSEFNTKLSFDANIPLVMSMSNCFQASHIDHIAQSISTKMKAPHAMQRSSDGTMFEIRVTVERRYSFQELLRVVENSRDWVGSDHGCGTCVAVVRTDADGHALHAVAPISVENEAVKCVNSWASQRTWTCTRSNFVRFYMVSVSLERIIVKDREGKWQPIKLPTELHIHSMSAAELLGPTKTEKLRDIERQRDELAERLKSDSRGLHQKQLAEVHKEYERQKQEWLCLSKQFVNDLKSELMGVKLDFVNERAEKNALRASYSKLEVDNERLLSKCQQLEAEKQRMKTEMENVRREKQELESIYSKRDFEKRQSLPLTRVAEPPLTPRQPSATLLPSTQISPKNPPCKVPSTVARSFASTSPIIPPKSSRAVPATVTPATRPTDTSVALPQPSLVFLPTTTKFVLQALQARQPATKDCDPSRLHLYLSDSDFRTVFGMSVSEFSKMPQWKQNDAKKKYALF
jgi:hypothetical protein